MGEQTAIEWTDHTFNPWWGCERVSPACQHCYAETLAKRFGTEWGKTAPRRFFGDKHWAEPLAWNRKAERDGVRRRVFCASMADVFEDRPDLWAPRARLFELIDATPHLDWLLLTKRPENIMRMVWQWEMTWPSNVWVGTTVEDQARAELRIPHLLAVPAAVRFLSCEPLLGPLDLSPWLPLEWMDALRPPGDPMSFRGEGGWGREMFSTILNLETEIGWVICGGESGPSARPMDPRWAADLRDQCQAAGVPFLFKQWGDHNEAGVKVGKKSAGRMLDGRTWDEFPRFGGPDAG